MKLHVGPSAYTVVRSSRAIFDLEGAELEGCCLESRRRIVLSRIVEPERLEEVAEHEFYHAWLFHVPKPNDDEEAAQLHSLIGRQFRQDVEDAGGPDAFAQLPLTDIRVGRPAGPRDIDDVVKHAASLLRDMQNIVKELKKRCPSPSNSGKTAPKKGGNNVRHI